MPLSSRTQSAIAQADLDTTKRLAERGLAQAQLALALRYAIGRDVPKDRAEAAQWFRRAGEQGIAQAQTNLGKAYLQGVGVPQDSIEAARWFHEAAKQGDSEAQNAYGMLLAAGNGVTQDDIKALDWYKKAAAQENSAAQYNLGRAYLDGHGEDRGYNPRKGVQWLRKAAANSHPRAQVQLGNLLERGHGVLAPDPAEAGRLYLQAANMGERTAQFNMGIIYDTASRSTNFDVEKDDNLAIKWYERAALQGYSQAGYNAGLMHSQGRGTTANPVEAVRFWKLAAEDGHPEAQFNVGLAHFKGYGAEQDHKKAAFWYREAAEQNVISAQYALGFLYENGQGVEQSLVLAEKWYRRASDAGDPHAKNKLLGLTFAKTKMPVSEQDAVMKSLGRIKDSLDLGYNFDSKSVMEPSIGSIFEARKLGSGTTAGKMELSAIVFVASVIVTIGQWSFFEVMLLSLAASLAIRVCQEVVTAAVAMQSARSHKAQPSDFRSSSAGNGDASPATQMSCKTCLTGETITAEACPHTTF